MKKDFNDIPNDPDTRILVHFEAMLGDLPVCVQGRAFEGVRAESMIFHAEDVKNLSDEELIAEVKESPLVDPEKGITLSRKNPDFAFVNFNFVVKD
ncbi:hypothetical protein [Marinicella gelatinilytica]|uniref:hypothetical protein n=1 Tax=Marinicella gelatinilytica TaxID=2996017 RepID=UPI0022608AE5|nr:hypothetical protein [Marinicella gelatinilytica]MCX7545990.1 hypothetical protein [Marinicella gelatinilytica]